MRITFVLAHADMSGGVRVVATYARLLQQRGHEVAILSTPRKPIPMRRRFMSMMFGNGGPRPGHEPSHIDDSGVTHRVLDRFRPVRNHDLPDGDVVIATWWETAEWVAALDPSKGAKVYFVQGYEALPGQPKDRVERTYALPLHKITISRWLVEMMKKCSGDDRMACVPNSVDMEQFHAQPRGKQSRPTVGMLYSRHWCKGFDVGLRAMELVRRAEPDARLVCFGLRKPAGELALPAGAEFYLSPPQHELRHLYARCDVWLCSSRMEGFYLPMLEAMACRCPVVSTRVAGPLDLIRDDFNGYLVDIDDAEAIAQRLLTVLNLPEPTWRSMSDAALLTARQYTWEDAADRFEAALTDAMKQTGTGRRPVHQEIESVGTR